MNHTGKPNDKGHPPSPAARTPADPQPGPIRSENPRRVRNGIKLRAREQEFATTWVAQRMQQLLERAFDATTLAEGFAYARAGQTSSMDVQPGKISARVQGRAPRAYPLEIRVEPMTEQQWHAAISAMASGAIYVARLLAGEVPPGLFELFADSGIELVPGDPQAMSVTCGCDEPRPCKHAAAVGYLLVERFNEEPLLVFTLYGMPAEQVLERLRQARAIHTHGVASAHADPMIPESQIDPLPLQACLEEFWRSGPQLTELESAPPPQHVAHALLRRLGPSPMKGRFPLVGLLASIYDTVSKEAIKIRDRAEHIEPTSAPDDEP